jgi:hypothetical protein
LRRYMLCCMRMMCCMRMHVLHAHDGMSILSL